MSLLAGPHSVRLNGVKRFLALLAGVSGGWSAAAGEGSRSKDTQAQP